MARVLSSVHAIWSLIDEGEYQCSVVRPLLWDITYSCSHLSCWAHGMVDQCVCVYLTHTSYSCVFGCPCKKSIHDKPVRACHIWLLCFRLSMYTMIHQLDQCAGCIAPCACLLSACQHIPSCVEHVCTVFWDRIHCSVCLDGMCQACSGSQHNVWHSPSTSVWFT